MLSVCSHAEKWGKKVLCCSSAPLSASLSEFGWVTPWLCVSAPSSHRGVLLHARFWSELQLLAETAMPAEALCVSANSLVLIGSSEEMGDPGKSSSASKLPPQEQCFSATQNSYTCLVSTGSLSLSSSFSKIIRATPIKNMVVNGVGFSIISSQ